MAEYLFADSVRLRVRGDQRVVRHFDAEYGQIAVPSAAGPGHPGTPVDGEPDVDVHIGWGFRVDSAAGDERVTGGHKTARWQVALGPPGRSPVRARIALAGGPPSFGLSLVQGYFVEALVAVALARAGKVALPGAAFALDDGVTVLLGRSGAGKTTLTARALAAGRPVLSDDQVVLDDQGRAQRYPRRLRFYPDIRETAPTAWARLPARTRSALLRRDKLQRLTRGYVAPSLAVPVTELGGTVESRPLPVRRIVFVERSAGAELTVTARETAWVAEQAGRLLADQRARLSAELFGGPWADALEAALQAESQTVASALAGVPASEILVPSAWGARRSVDALEVQLGLVRG
jgi:ABC-type cobalamin/Fe3+-siderophores transport system ATPase subunit